MMHYAHEARQIEVQMCPDGAIASRLHIAQPCTDLLPRCQHDLLRPSSCLSRFAVPPPILWPNWKKMFQAHLEAAGGCDWSDARRASALVSVLGWERQRKYFADADQQKARNISITAIGSSSPVVSKYEKLVEQLHRLFAASANTLVERHEFTGMVTTPDWRLPMVCGTLC